MCDSVCDTHVTQGALSVGSLELRPWEEELCLLERTQEGSLLREVEGSNGFLLLVGSATVF